MKINFVIVMFSLLLLFTARTSATNGLFLIGNHARSVAMGGADIAISSGSIGITANPANITTSTQQSFATNFTLITPSPEMNHPIAGEIDANSEAIPAGSLTYSIRPNEELPLSFGIGIYTPIGIAAKYPEFDPGMGIQGSIKTEFSVAKISPTICFHISKKLCLGASFELGYSRLKTGLYPEIAASPFFVGHYLDSDCFGYGGKFGVFYQISEQISLGAVYTMKMKLPMEGDYKENHETVNFKISGLNIPHVFECGVAYKPNSKLLLGFDFAYFNWNEAINTINIKRNELIPGSINPNPLSYEFDWKDQIGIALGLEYSITEEHKVRCGYNFGNNPVPPKIFFCNSQSSWNTTLLLAMATKRKGLPLILPMNIHLKTRIIVRLYYSIIPKSVFQIMLFM